MVDIYTLGLTNLDLGFKINESDFEQNVSNLEKIKIKIKIGYFSYFPLWMLFFDKNLKMLFERIAQLFFSFNINLLLYILLKKLIHSH